MPNPHSFQVGKCEYKFTETGLVIRDGGIYFGELSDTPTDGVIGGTHTVTDETLTSPTINNPTIAFDSATARGVKVGRLAITGAALHAATTLAWQNPESSAIIILRVWLDVTTVSTGAASVDVGYTATSATTTSDTLLDGVDVNAATAVFDSMNAALDAGANAKAQKAASAKWVTITQSAETTGLVANLYIEYVVV